MTKDAETPLDLDRLEAVANTSDRAGARVLVNKRTLLRLIAAARSSAHPKAEGGAESPCAWNHCAKARGKFDEPGSVPPCNVDCERRSSPASEAQAASVGGLRLRVCMAALERIEKSAWDNCDGDGPVQPRFDRVLNDVAAALEFAGMDAAEARLGFDNGPFDAPELQPNPIDWPTPLQLSSQERAPDTGGAK